MNDAEFIELLNLYLDHEISPEKAARLEAEVTRDPARRQVYRQYCRMQKACVVLASQFDGAAPEADVFAARPARRTHAALWATGLMAAACAAVAIAVHRHPADGPAAPAAGSVAQSAPVAAPAALAARGDFHPAFVARALASDPDASATAALFPAGAADGQFAWIGQVQMAPIGRLQTDPLFANPRPALDLDNRPESDRASAAGPAESAAFQFQR